jgi:Tol biopolymer transport system component
VLALPFNRSSQIWAMDPNGESRTAVQLTTGQTDGRSGIAPLVDGRVAYISRTGENLNIWVMNQDGTDQKQTTSNPYAIEELRSGGDGRYMVFSGYLDHKRPHLFRINIDGTDLRQLTSGDVREIDSSLSNDGKWIAYDSVAILGTKVELSLWKQSIEGGDRISLNRNDCQMPHFSPDDKYISCVREQKDILILSSVDGTLVHSIRVPQSATVNHTLNFGARWTPDGKAVAYIVNDKGVSNIWTHPIDGGGAKRLTDFTGGSIYHFAYSHDGSRLFVARGHQIRDAILITK